MNDPNFLKEWDELTDRAYEKLLEHGPDVLSEEELELAALWSLGVNVNNGTFVQFFGNCDRKVYQFSVVALDKIGADAMCNISKDAYEIVRHLDVDSLDMDGIEQSLPKGLLDELIRLSYEFMEFPDDLPRLGVQHYGRT